MICLWLLLMFQDEFTPPPSPILEGHSKEYCNLAYSYAPDACTLILYLDDGKESTAVKQLLGTDYKEYRKSDRAGTIEYRQAAFLTEMIDVAGRMAKIVVKHDTDPDVDSHIQYPAFGFHLRGETWQFHTTKSLDMFLIAMELQHIAKLRHIVFDIVQDGIMWKKAPFELNDGIPILVWNRTESRPKYDGWNVHIENYDLMTRGLMCPPNCVPTRTVTETWKRVVINDRGLEEQQKLTKEYKIPGNTPVSTMILYTDHGTLQLLSYYVARLVKEGLIPKLIIIP